VAATAAPSAEKGQAKLTIQLTPSIKVSSCVSDLVRGGPCGSVTHTLQVRRKG